MAVVPMKKMLICGLKKDRKHILEFLQRQEALEISNVLEEDSIFKKMDVTSSKTVFERNALVVEQALAVLAKYAPEKKGLLAAFEGREEMSLEEYENHAAMHDGVMKTAYRLQELEKEIAENQGTLPKLEQQITALEPWKDFDLPLDYRGTKKTAAFIGSLPGETTLEMIYEQLGQLAPQAEAVDAAIISSSAEQVCTVIICGREDGEAVEDALHKMNFSRPPLSSEIPAKRQEMLEQKVSQTRENIQRATDEAAGLSDRAEELKFVMDYYTMRAEKYSVLGGLVQSPRTFLITGYVSRPEAPKLEQALTSRYELAVEFTDPAEDEDIPVLLHNNKFAEPVESVVESYSLPGRGELDPSAVVATFYYVLYGLMLGDAAYGLIMVGGCAYCLKKIRNIEPGFKKMLKMFLYCGISTTFWGVMFGSFFGDSVNIIATTFFGRPDIRIMPLWFEPVSLPMKMLVFSFLIGIIHLFTGLGIKLYTCIKSGKILDGIYDAGFWYMLVGGAIIYLLTIPMFTNMLGLSFALPAALGTVCGVLAILGAVGIVLTGGRESRNWFKRILKGLYGVYGVTSYLSDILSYSRLLALGLATSVIATVFNKMGSMVGGNFFGAIVFILVFLVGHTLNLAINALGAYVHTNRLQFVEFFGKFYEGGGRKFTPFAIHTKYYKVKEDI